MNLKSSEGGIIHEIEITERGRNYYFNQRVGVRFVEFPIESEIILKFKGGEVQRYLGFLKKPIPIEPDLSEIEKTMNHDIDIWSFTLCGTKYDLASVYYDVMVVFDHGDIPR